MPGRRSIPASRRRWPSRSPPVSLWWSRWKAPPNADQLHQARNETGSDSSKTVHNSSQLAATRGVTTVVPMRGVPAVPRCARQSCARGPQPSAALEGGGSPRPRRQLVCKVDLPGRAPARRLVADKVAARRCSTTTATGEDGASLGGSSAAAPAGRFQGWPDAQGASS
jgi:hypothetical protein